MEGKVWKEQWDERMAAFAAAVNKTVEEINDALKDIVGEPSEQALEALSSEEFTPFDDLKEIFVKELKIPIALVRKNVAILRGPKPVEEVTGTAVAVLGQGVLPSAPEMMTLMMQLQTGGVSYFTRDDVIAAIVACVFDAVGLYEAPARISELILATTARTRKPCGDAFYEVDEILTETRYGELFSKMSRKPNQKFYSKTRKAEFLTRASGLLWAALETYYADLAAWQLQYSQALQAGMPLMMAQSMTGNKGGMGNILYPDTTPLRAAVGRFNDMFNMMFCGTGVVACKALAWDASRVMGILEKENITEMCGFTTKEELLDKLEIGVTTDFPIKMNQVVTFALGIMELANVPPGDQEYNYLNNLAQVGSYIPFKKYENGEMIPKKADSVWNKVGVGGKKAAGLLE